jgi:ankyrin repeat protein
MQRELEQAVRRGDLAAVRLALEAGTDVDARDAQGQSALMLAAHRGDLALVELLLAQGADPDQRAKYGLSALMLAALAGHEAVARALARAGADLRQEGSGAPGFAGRTAADLAAERGLPDLAEALRPPGR